ncbi:hypothetical protein ACFSR6_03415 [Pedobacter vanadiisoli]|uniref:Uncharacterized protein n=1 Tax=Pedobacter vanadiisoli TaxID=1761975 RepID=A0ABW5MFV9_9SPHI
MTNKEKFLDGFPFRLEKGGAFFRFEKYDFPNSIPGKLMFNHKGYRCLVMNVDEAGFMPYSAQDTFINRFFHFNKLTFLENDK